MAKKKELDKLSLDMIECEKDGYGCHYGKWKAMQAERKIEKRIPEDWRTCALCGKPFKPTNHAQKYCEYSCQREAANVRRKDAIRAQMKRYRERKKAEKELSNG